MAVSPLGAARATTGWEDSTLERAFRKSEARIAASMKFLFDLFPVIVFFATYKLAGGGDKGGACSVTPDTPIVQDPILLATGFAILATLIQVSWLLLRRKKVDGMLWVSLIIVTL